MSGSSGSSGDSTSSTGRRLEKEHAGEFVAISLEGEIILDRKMGKLLKRAIETFGHDNFAMARVRHEAMTECMWAE